MRRFLMTNALGVVWPTSRDTASLTRQSMIQAASRDRPKSRYNLMEDTLFRLVFIRYIPNTHVRKDKFASAMIVFVFSRKNSAAMSYHPHSDKGLTKSRAVRS